MEIIKIAKGAEQIIGTSSKGNQAKWHMGNKWVKQNALGYEAQAEVLASLILKCSTLDSSMYVTYEPCQIEFSDGKEVEGCYSLDFRGTKQEVTLERLFEANYTSTDPITNNKTLSTMEKFELLLYQILQFTGLDIRDELAQLFAFDALILNEDRHTNNILFLYDPLQKTWELAPIFDNGLSLLSDEKEYTPGKPVSILKRKVKAKPLNTSFSKQLALYQGKPFIYKERLLCELEQTTYNFGRAKEVLLSQLRDFAFAHLFIEGSEAHD